jgi:hypothetical protein
VDRRRRTRDQQPVQGQADHTMCSAAQIRHAARQPTALGIDKAPQLPNLREAHRANLAIHHARHGFSGSRSYPAHADPS